MALPGGFSHLFRMPLSISAMKGAVIKGKLIYQPRSSAPSGGPIRTKQLKIIMQTPPIIISTILIGLNIAQKSFLTKLLLIIQISLKTKYSRFYSSNCRLFFLKTPLKVSPALIRKKRASPPKRSSANICPAGMGSPSNISTNRMTAKAVLSTKIIKRIIEMALPGGFSHLFRMPLNTKATKGTI